MRSDNAGCYHCVHLILSLPSLGERAGIRIVRYDFSDPHAGKDVCDRRIATVKSHMRRYINEGHDIKSASDMKAAIDSYGGVKGCQAAVVKVQESSQTMKKHILNFFLFCNVFLGSMSTIKIVVVVVGFIFQYLRCTSSRACYINHFGRTLRNLLYEKGLLTTGGPSNKGTTDFKQRERGRRRGRRNRWEDWGENAVVTEIQT